MSWKSRADISIQNIIILVLVLEAVEKLKSCPGVDASRFYGTTDFQQRIYKILKDFFDFESQKPINRIAYKKADADYKLKIIKCSTKMLIKFNQKVQDVFIKIELDGKRI